MGAGNKEKEFKPVEKWRKIATLTLAVIDNSLCNFSKTRHFRGRPINTVDKDFFMLQSVAIKVLMRQGSHKSTGTFMIKPPSCTLL